MAELKVVEAGALTQVPENHEQNGKQDRPGKEPPHQERSAVVAHHAVHEPSPGPREKDPRAQEEQRDRGMEGNSGGGGNPIQPAGSEEVPQHGDRREEKNAEREPLRGDLAMPGFPIQREKRCGQQDEADA